MSRYRPEPRYSSGDLAYRDPPPQRWDTDRFARERDNRGPPVIEQRPPYDDYRSPPRRAPAAPVYEDQRYYEEDRYGPRGSRTERRYFEEEDYYSDPRAARGAMVPFRAERPARPEAPVRPGILRRQSSLDTFDRRPARRYYEHDEYRAGPIARVPERRADYEDVRIQEPDKYGDDGFREYREREWVTSRRRDGSRSRSRDREEVIEEVREVREEKPYPRKGKTRMPKRLVHTKVLYDLGYPYYEEDDRTILIEKALGPDNIDQIFTMSKEYMEREVVTTHLIEAPPSHPTIIGPPESVREVREERIEKVETVPISEAPRSVRDWDALSVRSPSPRSHRSRSRRRSRRGSSPGAVFQETIIEKKMVERDHSISPARTHRSHTTRRRGSSIGSGSEVIERTKIITRDDIEDSASVHVGPLALVVDRKPSRSERNIKEEIRQLEAERRALRRERRYEGDRGEIVKIERVRDRSPSPRGEIVIERRGEEILEVKKDRRGRSRSTAPSPGIIKAMMATLT